MLPPKHENYSKQGTFTDFLKGFDSQPDKREAGHSRHHQHQSSKKPGSKKVRRGSQGSESDIDAKSVTSSIRSSLSGTVKSEEVGDFPLPSELSPSYENATPPTPPTISQFPRKKKKAVSPPQLQPKMKKSKDPKEDKNFLLASCSWGLTNPFQCHEFPTPCVPYYPLQSVCTSR